MDTYFDTEEFNRWMANAKFTLKSAINDKDSEFYNWACFKAQQSAEYAVKAYLRGTGVNAFGHSISLLLKNANFDDDTINIAKTIDKFYIPTRYTDAWPDGIPSDYYTYNDAEEAVDAAESIINEVETKWRSLKEE
ncbi:HEPN domain-containing protein [Ferroplasma sp.]|uniref:HEPN domain-containing protein n=1 Tax=Ferroplasma sp. TaxID=2591003 RepID=UPI00307F5859